MNGQEKSDSVIVAVKPTNKAERSAAELVEPRGGQGTRNPTTHAPGAEPDKRVTCVGSQTASALCRHCPRWEPYAGIPLLRICAGDVR